MLLLLELGGISASIARNTSNMELTYLEHGPPTDYAISAFVEGQPGSSLRVVNLTLQRSLLILPGLYVVGLRNKDLILASLSASCSITLGLLAWYKWSRT